MAFISACTAVVLLFFFKDFILSRNSLLSAPVYFLMNSFTLDSGTILYDLRQGRALVGDELFYNRFSPNHFIECRTPNIQLSYVLYNGEMGITKFTIT